MNIKWFYKSFTSLSPFELYAILQLRNEVFVVEQNCIFQDADNKDQVSCHVLGMQDDRLMAYARLIPAGVAFNELSIGRVVTAQDARGTGLGKQLMTESIITIKRIWGPHNIRIGAQLYLQKFYESLGFQQISDIYLEDGIEHIEMLLHTGY